MNKKIIKIIDWYLLKSLSLPFTYCLFAFVVFYVVYDLSVHMDQFLKTQVTFPAVVWYYVNSLPVIMVNLMPVAVLLSMLYTLGTLSRYNEISAMRTSGIHLYRIIAPFLFAGVVISFAVMYINERLVPDSLLQSMIIKERDIDKEGRFAEEIWKDFPFRNPLENRYWIGSYDSKEKTMYDVVVREVGDDGKVKRKIIADYCQWIDERWWFFNGTILRLREHSAVGDEKHASTIPMESEHFTKMKMDFEEGPSDFESSQKLPAFMSYAELKKHITIHPVASKVYKEKTFELFSKRAFPFINLVAVLISIPFGTSFRTRGGLLLGVGISMFIFLAYYCFRILLIAFVTLAIDSGIPFPIGFVAWLPNLVFGIGGVIMIVKNR